MLYATEKTLKDYGDKVDEATRTEISEAVDNLKKAVADKQIDALKSGMDRLNEATHKLSSKLYEHAAGQQAAGAGQAGPQQETGPGPGTGSSADDVVDAEFEVKDEKRG